MYYPFECPECGTKQDIEMKITEYHSDNHLCPNCKTEMKREVSSLVCGLSVDKTNSFYRRCN